jgi:hypothetical protein
VFQWAEGESFGIMEGWEMETKWKMDNSYRISWR